jgi:hypothetical protein
VPVAGKNKTDAIIKKRSLKKDLYFISKPSIVQFTSSLYLLLVPKLFFGSGFNGIRFV